MKNTLVKASAKAHEGAMTLTDAQWLGESPVWGFNISMYVGKIGTVKTYCRIGCLPTYYIPTSVP